MDMKKKKNKKWIKFRHRPIRNILFATLGVYTRLKYRIAIKRFGEQEKRPYLVLFNHQTAFDQFFVGMSFKRPVYYLASEDIFSNGFVSSLIRYLVAPIPIKKQTMDLKAIKICLQVAREGGTIAIAPEGNRTYSGKTGYMSPSIASLARKLGMPIVLYRIEGGYGVHPRWSDVVRKGKMRSYVSRVISPEEYATLTDAQLFDIIQKELFVDEACADGEFHHKKRAEYLERAFYVCPSCGLSTLESHKNTVTCKTCGRAVEYLPTKELKGVGKPFPFTFLSDWYDYQSDFVNHLDVLAHRDEPLYRERVMLSRVIPYKKKKKLCKNASIALFGDRIEISTDSSDMVFPFDNSSAVTVLGKNKLNIYHGGEIYQCKGDKRFNALKYVQIYHRCLNVTKGDENGKFLGL